MIGRIARFNRVGAGLLAVLALAFVISGQENTPKKPHGGLVTDWTSRHLVFSSSGTLDMTDKITQDPRYQMQWARRNFHPVVAGGAPESNDVLSPAALLAKKKKVGIEKDWGYEFASTAFSSAPLGGLLFPAKYSFDTSTATCDDYVVYPVDVVGSSTAVFATDSGTVSSTGPTNGQTATITNGANVDTVIATAAMEATANGTVTATTGSNGQTATITNGANVDTITATAAAFATAHGTFTSTGMTVGQQISITGASGSPTITLTAAAPATGTITVNAVPANGTTLTVGTITYEFENGITCLAVVCIYTGNGTTTTTLAENIEAAINDNSAECGQNSGIGACIDNIPSANPGATASIQSAGVTLVTNISTGSIAFTGGTGLSRSGSGTIPGPAAGSFVVTGVAATDATNLIAAIGVAGQGSSVGVTAASGGSGVVNLTASTIGAGSNTIALSNGTATNFAWSGTTLSGGITQQCVTTCNNGGVEYFGVTSAAGAADSAATIAGNMVAAFNANVGSVGILATNPSGATVTITATTAGTAGNSITLTEGLVNFSWASGTLAGGASLLTGNEYVPITSTNGAALTATQIAANMVTAFNANVASTGITASTTGGGNVTITANAAGIAGNNITATDTMTNFGWATGTLTGGMIGQASIIAYNNLYVGTPAGGSGAAPCGGTASAPPVKTAWAYNTGGTVTTSPTISLDGTQITFVQNNGSNAAQLVMLKPLTNVGVDAYNNVNAGLTVASSAAVYRSCAAPCMYAITFALDAGTGTQESDGRATTGARGSSVWYDYAFDVVYVGDDRGYIHQFTGVFNGDPVEVTTTPWPVASAATATGNTEPVTSVVYDESRNVMYFGDRGGHVAWMNVATGAVTSSNKVGNGAQDMFDGPLVDPSAGANGILYESVAQGTADAAIYQFAGEFTGATSGTQVATGNDPSTYAFTGSFDNAYYSGAATGHLYVCGVTSSGNSRPAMWEIPITTATNAMGTAVIQSTLATAGGATQCSNITEVDNGTDYIYVSVVNDGSTALGCTGNAGCVMVFSDTGTGTLTWVAGTAQTGGISGLVIDNFVTGSGASNIYFSPLTAAACTTSGTGGCAVQAAQGPGL